MNAPARKGWFFIEGVQTGERTFEEQVMGLAPMLAEVKGKSVLDLGCAEGLIARECVARGASRVLGIDSNVEFIRSATSLAMDRAVFMESDLNKDPREELTAYQSDVVLLLAIIHKLMDPDSRLRLWAKCASELVVIRLPRGSNGTIASKHMTGSVDSKAVMPKLGFRLERDEAGPRMERVHYWRRTA